MDIAISLRASKAPLVATCPGAYLELSRNPSSVDEAAESGKEIHACLASFLSTGVNVSDRLRDDEKIVYKSALKAFRIVAENLGVFGEDVACEVQTSRRFGDIELTATLDVLIEGVDGTVVFVDWKTGFLEPSRHQWMQLLQAAVIGGPENKDFDGAYLVFISPKLAKAFVRYVCSKDIELARNDLLSAASQSAAAARAESEGRETLGYYTISPLCKFCPGFGVCPAWRNRVKLIAGNNQDDAIKGLSLGETYIMADALAARCSQIIDMVKEHARKSPVDLGGGSRLELSEYRRRDVNVGKLAEVCDMMFVGTTDSQTLLSNISISKTAAERAIKVASGGNHKTVAEIMAAAEEMGAVTERVEHQIRVKTTKEQTSNGGGDEHSDIE